MLLPERPRLACQNSVVQARRLSAPVLEGQQHARAIRLYLAVLDLHVLLHDLGNSQVTQRARSGFNRILCGGLPRHRARADYFHDFIDRVRNSTLFAHNFYSMLDVLFDVVVTLTILALLQSRVNSSTRLTMGSPFELSAVHPVVEFICLLSLPTPIC